ncbi:MAG: protein kinase [Polyangiaceae bacterium]|nr:protein kinase [Polyangiaceae bacterium]
MDTQTGVNDAATFGKYRLIASLGHGGMADVFLAVAQGPVGFNKLQVIKRLRPNLAEEPEFLSMFLDEARLAARLNHPNIVQTNEVGEVAGQYFIAMEYLDGQPMHRIVHRGGKNGALTRPMGLKILADALGGLHSAHELCDYDGSPLHVVHRDASPHNIFITYEGQTKLVDFGIAKAATRSAETRTGVLKGKIGYMAPEQARCEKVDRRADVFSVGVILWEVVTGSRMWKGLSDVEILDNLMHGRIPDVTQIRQDLPPDLVNIVRRSLAPSANDRYQTASDLRHELLDHLAREGSRVSEEEIGQVVASLFQDKRGQLKSILEKQLSGLKTGQFEGIRIIDLPASSVSLPRITSTSVSDPTPSATLNPIAPPAVAVTQASAPPPAASKKIPLIIGGAAAAAVAVGVLILGRPAPPAVGASPPVETSKPAETAAAKPNSVATIDLKLTVSPPDAVVYLDEAKLAAPYTMKAPADGFGHKLRVEANGYTTESRMLVFDKDVTLDIALTPDKQAAAPTTQGQQGAVRNNATPPSGDDGFTKPTIKPNKKKLDSDDPWKK